MYGLSRGVLEGVLYKGDTRSLGYRSYGAAGFRVFDREH